MIEFHNDPREVGLAGFVADSIRDLILGPKFVAQIFERSSGTAFEGEHSESSSEIDTGNPIVRLWVSPVAFQQFWDIVDAPGGSVLLTDARGSGRITTVTFDLLPNTDPVVGPVLERLVWLVTAILVIQLIELIRFFWR
jgi:hypothetical protein